MTMSYRHRDDVITTHYSTKASAKAIDKICAKLHLHIDSDKNNSEMVDNVKNEIIDVPADRQGHYMTREERSGDIALDNTIKQESGCGTNDMDMYSYDSPKSRYDPCPSSPTMAYIKDSPSNNVGTSYDKNRQSSPVIASVHDNMYDMSPVFVSTHDDMSYDVHPSSPVIEHMMSRNETVYSRINSKSPVDEVEMSASPKSEVNQENFIPQANNATPSPPLNETQNTEKIETKTNKVKPRHTTQYNNWHHNDMIMAIKAVQMKYLSMTAAAKRYGIPRTTLRHYLHDGTNRETKRACFSLAKKAEEDLVQYALDNCHVNEKTLYKMIFDKAKEFSQNSMVETGEDSRRVVPTPAWIRRFVYRHKQLHNIFPTFLAKWEHPVIDRKLPTEKEEYSVCNGSHQHETNMKIGKDKVCTEIIFPKNKSDSYFSPHRSEMNGNSSTVCSDQQMQSRLDNHVTQVNSLYARTSLEHGDSYLEHDIRRNSSVKGEKFHSDDEHVLPYKDLLARISKPSYSKITSSRSTQMMDLNYSPPHHTRERKNPDPLPNLSASDPTELRGSKYVSHSSIPMMRPRQYAAQADSPTSSVADIQVGKELDETAKDDFSYSEKLRSLVKPSSSEDNHVNESGNYVLKITLDAMEESLGVDNVEKFKKRYTRNKTLERLYGKWVSLRSELDSAG